MTKGRMSDTPGAIPPPTAEDLSWDLANDYASRLALSQDEDEISSVFAPTIMGYIRRCHAAESAHKETLGLLANMVEIRAEQDAKLQSAESALAALRETIATCAHCFCSVELDEPICIACIDRGHENPTDECGICSALVPIEEEPPHADA